MSKMTIQLPDSIKREVETLAARDGISSDQFLATAAAEKVSALRTVDYLKEEAAKGSAEEWHYVLNRARHARRCRVMRRSNPGGTFL